MTEEEILNSVEVLDVETVFIENLIEEMAEAKASPLHEKKLIYLSSGIFIFKFEYKEKCLDESNNLIEGDSYTIYQVYDRDSEKSEYHCCIDDERLEKSVLLNMINRGDSISNKKRYL